MSLEDIFWEEATSDEIAALEAAEETKYLASCAVDELTADLDDAVRKLAHLRQELDRAQAKQERADKYMRELEIEIGRSIIKRKAEGTSA